MKVLSHHVYEYKKGLRNLVLHTMNKRHLNAAKETLERNEIAYLIRNLGQNKINIFFGSKACVNVIEQFGYKSLSDFTPEEDFILGIMLGYDRLRQCDRYLERQQNCLPQLQELLQAV